MGVEPDFGIAAPRSSLSQRYPGYSAAPFGVDRHSFFIPLSERGALLHPHRLRGVELPVALLDAARPLVPGNDDADMVRASPLACSGDFLLRLAGC